MTKKSSIRVLLLGYVVLVAVAITFLLPVNAELISNCQRFDNEIMVGAERVNQITYDCKIGNFVIQHGLTIQEKDVLENIAIAKANGSYVRPPIDNSTGVFDFENPLCMVEHFDTVTKKQYGCY